jgi:hypothetical protein
MVLNKIIELSNIIDGPDFCLKTIIGIIDSDSVIRWKGQLNGILPEDGGRDILRKRNF